MGCLYLVAGSNSLVLFLAAVLVSEFLLEPYDLQCAAVCIFFRLFNFGLAWVSSGVSRWHKGTKPADGGKCYGRELFRYTRLCCIVGVR